MKEKSIHIFIITKFQKEGSYCISQKMVLIDTTFKMTKKYYPQVFLEECKYIVKENKVTKYINEDLESLLMNLIKKILVKNELKIF